MPANAPATYPSGQLPSGSWLNLLLRCAPQKDAAAIPHAVAGLKKQKLLRIGLQFLLFLKCFIKNVFKARSSFANTINME